ncbi:Hypothetical_protein [Hexamita inflata]|uniref:Hypothetical_protein n=1 Tax=Hexamita inflata TaxID=28002 RepID=A0AA86QR69_9EUKA|nr:Hypothetical protein HINF_LOCUS52114 [Hexamita inflata]
MPNKGINYHKENDISVAKTQKFVQAQFQVNTHQPQFLPLSERYFIPKCKQNEKLNNYIQQLLIGKQSRYLLITDMSQLVKVNIYYIFNNRGDAITYQQQTL